MSIKITSTSRIKVIGDSMAAGRGASDCAYDGEYIMKFNGRNFYRQSGKRCWVSILKDYIETKYPGAQVINNSANSITSHHLHKFMHNLVEPQDTILLIMIGCNNRKQTVGMALLRNDMRRFLRFCKEWEKEVVIITPAPSTLANEHRGDRIYHMNQVDEVLKEVAEEFNLPCVSIYDYLMEHAEVNGLTIEELMVPLDELEKYNLPESTDDFTVQDWDRIPDGMHPPDSVHKLIAKHVVDVLEW